MTDMPTVVDLFCGGGGFSEGFRRAGFDILYAVDKASDAVETYRLNHPWTETVEADVTDLAVDDLPDEVDVLIGSPPCTEFSMAKEGGNGDIDAGMELVGEFLRLVVELDPEYWVMENVPRLDHHLEQTIDFDQLPMLDRFSGQLSIPYKEVLDCSEYGTPQRRRRLFSGDLPWPRRRAPPPALGEIQDRYPYPMDGPSEGRIFEDPLHDLRLPEPALTDYFYNSFLTKREAEEIRIQKEDHSFYGPMSFPDNPDVPARTVIALNRRIARETLVLEEDEPLDGFSRFRRPTIREIATIQGFPITYQFTGSNVATKWQRVGDAVPPTMSYAIADAIRQDMGLGSTVVERTDEVPIDHDLNDETFSEKGHRELSLGRRFRHHVPMDNMRRLRIDLESYKDGAPTHPVAPWIEPTGDKEGPMTHPVRFGVHYYRGYAAEVQDTDVELDEALELLEDITDDEQRGRTIEFLKSLEAAFETSVPDATTVQAIRSRRLVNTDIDPVIEYTLLRRIDDLVDEYFPSLLFGDWWVGCPDLLDGSDITGRGLMKLVAANYLAWKLNHGAVWIVENPEAWYLPDGWTLTESRRGVSTALSEDFLPDAQASESIKSAVDSLRE